MNQQQINRTTALVWTAILKRHVPLMPPIKF